MRKLQSGKYYWNVQAVDQGYLGGVWSVVDSFTVKNTQAFFKTDTVCLGLDTHFTDQSVASEGIASWKWDFKDGTISSLQNPVHTFGSGGAHYVKLVVTSTSGIKDSLEKTILVKPRPITDFSATTACQGSETGLVNLTNNSGLNITSWSWDYGDGKGSILQNPGSHGYLNAGDYQLTLTVTADNGCSGTVTKSVTVGAYPIAAITANTPLSFCSGGSVILSVTNNTDYSYRWMLNKTGITGAVSNNFTANLSGIYSVEVTNTRGSCIDTSAIVSVVKLDMPAIPLIVTENYQEGKCPGEIPVVLKVDQPVNEYNYQWKRNGTPINNALTSSHQGFLPAGDYSVVVNQQGCKAESEVKTIIYDEAPAKPFIYVQGPSVWYLTCSNDSASKYRWYCNDNLIEGADKYYYVANRKMGKYKVSIANTKGCFTMSDFISIPTGTTGIEDTDPFSSLKIYPNPTPGLFAIEMDNQISGVLTLKILTTDGKEVLSRKINKSTVKFSSQIDLSGQGKGLYLIYLKMEEYFNISKIIIE
jgi:PKD repeat protein